MKNKVERVKAYYNDPANKPLTGQEFRVQFGRLTEEEVKQLERVVVVTKAGLIERN